jgi:peptide/nickel transport system ATP-binding protein
MPARARQRAARLPVIDDYLQGSDPAAGCRSARAAMRRTTRTCWWSNLSKSFFAARRPVRQARIQGREGRLVHARARQNAGRGGRIRLGQDHGRPDPAAPAPATGGSALFDGRDLLALPDREYAAYKRRIQIIFQNPYASLNPRFTVGQILLEPMRIHGIGADDDERTNAGMACWSGSAAGRRPSAATRTSFPAASASASPSRAA